MHMIYPSWLRIASQFARASLVLQGSVKPNTCPTHHAYNRLFQTASLINRSDYASDAGGGNGGVKGNQSLNIRTFLWVLSCWLII